MAVSVGTYYRNMANLGLVLVKMLLKKLLLINVRSFLGRKIIKLKRKPRTQVQTKFLESKLGKHLPQKSPVPNII
jgi:hypothetical protein